MDTVVVLDPAVWGGADEVRVVDAEHAAHRHLEPGLLVHLPKQRVSRMLAMVDTTAG
ncbi:MAG TPA: hypothetical protein VK059_12410 [Nocardioidaceae bacterium]|nr:hypothetical protein [Nocardioidaceae bacterium]